MNMDVLPTTCAGVNSPFPFTTTMTGWPLHTALMCPAFFAWLGSAVATGTMTAVANATHAAAVGRRRLIALPFRSGRACSGTDPICDHGARAPYAATRAVAEPPKLLSKPHGAWRSLVSALVWGTRGPEFESRRPDQRKARLRRGFSVFGERCQIGRGDKIARCGYTCASPGVRPWPRRPSERSRRSSDTSCAADRRARRAIASPNCGANRTGRPRWGAGIRVWLTFRIRRVVRRLATRRCSRMRRRGATRATPRSTHSPGRWRSSSSGTGAANRRRPVAQFVPSLDVEDIA
jgi:hypothetical protein